MVTITPALAPLMLYRYYLVFPLMVLEGTVITVIAGALVNAGIFNFWGILLCAIFAALTGDIVHYLIGRHGQDRYVSKWLLKHEHSAAKFESYKVAFHKHPGRVLLLSKFSFAFTSFGLLAAGMAKVSIRKFIWYNFIGEVPKSTLLVLTGFLLGDAYAKFTHYLTLSLWILFFVGVIVGISIIFIRKEQQYFKKFFKNTDL